MHLRSIQLRDFKAYGQARFDFPRPSDNKNVILIGGLNGFGKTTLFEAIVLGLFGRDGLGLIARAAAASDDAKRNQSFREFMQRALNGYALRQGRRSCCITLVFEDEAGRPIEIARTWHYSADGQLRQSESDEIRITRGLNREIVNPDQTEPDPGGWYRDWISREFLPVTQAGFFMFDGEAAAVYAERDMRVQVREGIEGLLGLTWLRQLQEDLRTYAVRRRSEVPKDATTDRVKSLDEEVQDLEKDLGDAKQRHDKIADDLTGAEAERDALIRELAGYGTGSRAQYEDLVRERADRAKVYGDAYRELQQLAERELPLALAGATARGKVEARIRSEIRREQWLAAAAESGPRVRQVVDTVERELTAVVPPLVPAQSLAVKAALDRALEQLWHPAPADAAETFRHPHLRGPIAERVLMRLEAAANVTAGKVLSLLDTLGREAAALRSVGEAIRNTETTAPWLEEKRQSLTNLEKKIRSLSEEKGRLSLYIQSREPQLAQKRAELARLTDQLDQSQRPARLARRAEAVAAMLTNLIEEAWPLQAKAVADAMTAAIQAMAHRNDYLHSVDIADNGEVRLLTPTGTNLRDLDLSAGEKQIFTQALFSAIAKVTGRVFPLVVDTPLGRLDEQHRVCVLRHLAARNGQVILLSTNTEVVGPYLDSIRDRIAKAYRIENEVDGDLGRSWPVEGYFPDQGL
jgi:DNA sulfur modification protein DndD